MIRSRWQARSDSGFALVSALAAAFVILGLTLLVGAAGVNALRSSRQHVTYAQNLDVAEAGIDQVSARLQVQKTYSYCPATPACDVPGAGDAVYGDVQSNGFQSKADESKWARTTLTQLASANTSLLTTTAAGQYLTIRPASINTIYSMAWVPSYAKASRMRLVKSEYIFSTFRPPGAILTNGNITCCSSYDVGLAPGVSTSVPFGIHTNGTISGVPGSVTPGVTVTATATGSCSSPCVGGQPPMTIPAIDPRAVYRSEAPKYAGAWYDLCPSGGSVPAGVYKPDTVTGVPCSVSANLITTTLPFRGWSRSSSNVWTNSGGNYPGVYYVYRGSMDFNNVTFTGAMTMITEATANRACPKTDGDQSYKKVDWLSGGYIPNLMVLSGSYWYQNTQTHMGSGAILAQGYVEQQTSSAPGVTGFLVAENFCRASDSSEATNRLQGSVLYYNGGADLPLGGLIRSTLELEL